MDPHRLLLAPRSRTKSWLRDPTGIITAGCYAEDVGPGIIAAFFAAAAAPTFSHDVAPLLYKSCATCHHQGANLKVDLINVGSLGGIMTDAAIRIPAL